MTAWVGYKPFRCKCGNNAFMQLDFDGYRFKCLKCGKIKSFKNPIF